MILRKALYSLFCAATFGFSANASASTIYVDDNFTDPTIGNDPDGAGPATNFGTDSFASIQGAIDASLAGDTIQVAAGSYNEDVNISKTLTIQGAGPAASTVSGPIGGDNVTFRITANGIVLDGFKITRDGNNTTDWNNPNLNSAGVAIQGLAITGSIIRNCHITGNRTGIDINNSNGQTIRNNVIDFNHTGVIFRHQTDTMVVVQNFITNNRTVGISFLDGSAGTNVPVQRALNCNFNNNNISGNWYGQVVERQSGGALPAPGTNLKNFVGNWFGTATPIVTTANTAEPGYATLIPVAYGGAATPPGGQPDLAGPASANIVYNPLISAGTDLEPTYGFQGPVPPAIVVGPSSLTNDYGTTAQFSVTATGGALSYQWDLDSTVIPGATTSTLSITNAGSANEGTYTVTVFNDVGTNSASASLSFNPDIALPVVKITSPKANSVQTTNEIILSGTATDNFGVASVSYSLNGAVLAPATYTAPTWSTNVTLIPGTNTLVVSATDLAGNTTNAVPVKFYYHVSSALTIVTNLDGGSVGTNNVGTVVNAIPVSLQSGNNTTLFVGRTYTLKALESGLPKNAFILTNWTATWQGQTGGPVVLQTNNLTCTFEMKSNMVVNANFISNPFARFGGTYLGLFSDATNLTFNSAGYAQVKVTPKQTFSAKLRVDGNVVSVSGKLKIDGTGTGVSKTRETKTGKPEVTMTVALDFAGATDSLSGTVSEVGDAWSSDLLAYRNVWSKTDTNQQADFFTNNYTMQVPSASTNSSEGPMGTLGAALKIDLRGKVVVNGTGLDAHAVKQSTWISKDGQWPLFAPQYKVKRDNNGKLIAETRGFTMGWLQFTTNLLGKLRPEGEVHTIKTSWTNDLFTPGWTNSIYVGGFSNSGEVVSSLWAFDKEAASNALTITNVLISFSEGNLGTNAFSNTWDVTEKSTLAPIRTNTYAHFEKAAVVPKNGVFKGTFEATPGVKTKYQGVLLQDTQTGAGSFIGTTVGGKVDLVEVP